ncbi:MAG: DNA-processing protein DprA [Acidobacteriota bacterium]
MNDNLAPALHRDLTIALTTTDTLPRAVAYRLAWSLDRWLDRTSPSAALATELGVPETSLARAFALRHTADRDAATARARAARHDARLVVAGDPDWPAALATLAVPPPLLVVRGELPDAERPAVAIVGARRMNAYGRATAHRLATDLAALGIVVVSGFARGIDATAHDAAAATGHTVAVLGCGIDIDYPRRSRALAERIANRGALISEFPIGVEPRAWHFPVRNRIIAALGHGTLVIQASRRSGSLITAGRALDLGRDVYAVPGRIDDPLAAGPNDLIADGAVPIRHVDDLLDCLPMTTRDRLTTPPIPIDSAVETTARGVPARIATWLLDRPDPVDAETIATALDVSIDRVLAALLELELLSRIKRLPGPRFVAIRPRN